MAKLEGTSPLARGNPMPLTLYSTCRRPIPARAGQPLGFDALGITRRAHPRSRGATVLIEHRVHSWWGPSPLARGNRHRRPAARVRAGPIPARAGQPCAGRCAGRPQRAHPRSRGATPEKPPSPACRKGPSPLARGNHDVFTGRIVFNGPIPARAGQPFAEPPGRPRRRAHPRSRGATMPGAQSARAARGPSPLARGNRA